MAIYLYIQNALPVRGSFAALRMTSRATEIATSGIALLAMTTPCVVILNEVKNLSGSTTLSGRTNFEFLRCTQDDILAHQHNRGHLTISRVTKM